MFRTITCQYLDCAERILAANESAHYKYDCRSSYLKRRFELVARARRNRGYARPWGVDLEFDVDVGNDGSTGVTVPPAGAISNSLILKTQGESNVTAALEGEVVGLSAEP